MSDDPRDERSPHEVLSSSVVFEGAVWDVRQDEVRLGDGGDVVVRDFIDHPGAVGVIALDDADRVLLVRQYRHPVGAYLWEPPAGLLDVDDEHPLVGAQRELHEEAHHVAGRWDVLYDVFTSPGASSESLRCFLARDVREADDERFAGSGEEREMPVRWVPLDDLVAQVLDGALHNPTTVTGVLAAYASRAGGWASLRDVDTPWPERFPDGLPPR